jgi:tetratricopeptide (TPR) repeat protein
MAENQEKFRTAINRGNSAAWDMDWQGAAIYYQQALDECPENPLALTSMGLALYEQHKFAEAIEYYKKAALVGPEDPIAPEKIADIFERQGRLKEAIQAVVHAAELYLKIRDAEKAISCYERATSLDPMNLHARTRLALIFERMHKYDQAITEFLAAASILQRTGQLDRAKKTVEHCLMLDGSNEKALKARKALGEMDMLPEPPRRKDVSASLRMAEVMEPKKDPTTKELITMEDTLPTEYFKQKSLVVLASMLFDPVTSFPLVNGSARNLSKKQQDDIMVSLNRAVDTLTHNREDKAIDHLEDLMRFGLDSSAVYYNLGFVLMDINPRRAVEVLQLCVQKDDYAMGAFSLLGQIFQKRGGVNNLRKAAAFYLRALGMADLFTVDSSRHASLREAYVPVLDIPQQISGEKELKDLCNTISSQIYRKDWLNYLISIRAQLPEMDPKQPAPISELVLKSNNTQVLEAIAHIRVLVLERKFDAALEETYYALQFAPNYLPLHIEIARLMSYQDDINRAVEKFSLISRLYILRGELLQGAKMMEEALKLSPLDVELRQQLIGLLVGQDQYQQALDQYMILADNFEVFANFDQMRKVYFDALRLASRLPNSRDWSVRILTAIADIDMKRLDWHRAQRVYEQIKTLIPDDEETRKNLIGVYYRLGQNEAAQNEIDDYMSIIRNSHQFEKGIDFLQALITEWPQKYDQRRQLAEVYVRMGRKESALDELNKVASAYLDEGQTEQTVDILQRMMTIDPEHGGEYQMVVNRLRKQK